MIEGRLKEEIERGIAADAKVPPGPLETFRYRVNKRLFRVRFENETENCAIAFGRRTDRGKKWI